VAGPPGLAEIVERAGYRFWVGEAPPEDELATTWARVPMASRGEAEAIVIGEIFAGLNVRAILPSLDAACAEWRPALVLRDPSEFASAFASERHGIPHARIGTGLLATERTALSIAEPVIEGRSSGVTDRIWRSPYLTLFPASLEDPQVNPPPVVHRFHDPADAAPSEPLPDWWADDARPLVYVSFGSVTGGLPIAGAVVAYTHYPRRTPHWPPSPRPPSRRAPPRLRRRRSDSAAAASGATASRASHANNRYEAAALARRRPPYRK
jgi:hypothetical protein